MTELLTAAQMRAIESAAISSGEVTGLELMERAGRGVVEAVFEEWPELRATSHRAVVLCGPGGNGGDGFVVARLLKEWGWEVEVFLYGTPEAMPPDARVNYERWMGMGEVGEIEAAGFSNCDIVVDAIFGIGLTRSFEPPSDLVEEFHPIMKDGLWWSGTQSKPFVIAIDVVSTVDADSGRYLGRDGTWANEIGAHLTVTFHRPKLGHFLDAAPLISPRVVVADIGLEGFQASLFSRSARLSLVNLADAPDWNPFGPSVSKGDRMPSSIEETHKYSHGHALILSGPSGRGGAARLSARGALRIGAGVVTVGCLEGALAENAARLDAVMLRVVADGEALALALEDRRIKALCLGPGMGLGAREAGLLAVALGRRGEPRPTVLD
ncbi:MAG: NAD(P)H-hydrate epimerase, partial [Paracoccaceae bacterium]